MENQKNNADAGKRKSKFWKFALTFLAIFILIDGGYFVWDRYFSPAARYQRETQKNYEKYLDWQADYEKAMREDTYGGKTPEETLNMFIEALKKEDVELASRYFMLDENGEVSKKWIDLLDKVKQEGNLKKMANDIEKYDEAKETFDPYYLFIYRNKDKTVGLQITMIFNSQTSIWKIASL